jgi:hypothetical protein
MEKELSLHELNMRAWADDAARYDAREEISNAAKDAVSVAMGGGRNEKRYRKDLRPVVMPDAGDTAAKPAE